MFENEIKRIYSHNLNKVKNLGSYINFEQLISANLHPAILQYISAEIDYRIFEDRQKILKDSVFDYSSEKIRHHFSQINKELKKNKRFSQQYINKLILHAVSFNVNYLARPKWALLKFIYNTVQEKPTDEIKQVLNYIHYYAYLRKILTLYIDKKNILLLSKGEFKDLLTKVDESGIESNQSAIVDKALESMSEFFNVGSSDKTIIPLPSVKLFFQEKNLVPQLNKINHKFGAENKDSIDLEEIKNALVEKEASLDEESEKIIKELVEQETGFSNTDQQESELDEEEILNEKNEDNNGDNERIHIEDDNLDEDAEDLGAGFVQKKLEEVDLGKDFEHVTMDKIEETESLDENDSIEIKEDDVVEPEEENEEGEVIAEDGMPNMNDESLSSDEEIQIDSRDSDENELIIESELSGDEALDLDDSSLTLEDEPKEKSDLRLVDNSVNQKENSESELEIEDSALEVSDEEMLNEEDDEEQHEVIEEPADEEEIIEMKEDVFEESDEDEEEDEAQLTESEEANAVVEKSELDLADDDTLSGIIENEFESDLQKIDMSDLVQNKKMTKIIEVIFDYDMEDYSNTIEKISECLNLNDAEQVLEKLYSTNRINSKSKEAHLFKELISEYFN